jgi:hypothetical protein
MSKDGGGRETSGPGVGHSTDSNAMGLCFRFESFLIFFCSQWSCLEDPWSVGQWRVSWLVIHKEEREAVDYNLLCKILWAVQWLRILAFRKLWGLGRWILLLEHGEISLEFWKEGLTVAWRIFRCILCWKKYVSVSWREVGLAFGGWRVIFQEGLFKIFPSYLKVLCGKLMWVNSLCSYPCLNQQKPLSLPVIAYTLSTTKLEIRAK